MKQRIVEVISFTVSSNGTPIELSIIPSDFGNPTGLYTHTTCGAIFFVDLDALRYLAEMTLDELCADLVCPECNANLEVAPYPHKYVIPGSGKVEEYVGPLPDLDSKSNWTRIEAWDLTARWR